MQVLSWILEERENDDYLTKKTGHSPTYIILHDTVKVRNYLVRDFILFCKVMLTFVLG